MRLVCYRSSNSAGMSGYSVFQSVEYTQNGECLVNSSTRLPADMTSYIRNYYAEGLLDKISEVCERYNVISWKDVPKTELTIQDAATSDYTFVFEDGTAVELNTATRWIAQCSQAVAEIGELITESESYGTDVAINPGPGTQTGSMMMGLAMCPKVQVMVQKNQGSNQPEG